MRDAFARLNSRDRRAVLCGSAAILASLLIALVILPLADASRDELERAATQRRLLVRELAVIAETGRDRRMLSELEHVTGAEASRLFPGPDPIGATARLLETVTEAASRNGVLLDLTENEAARPLGQGLLAMQMDVRGRGDLASVLHFLRALEGGRRLVRVERLELEPESPGEVAGSPPPDSAARTVNAIVIGATIVGYSSDSNGTSAPRR